VVLLGLFVIAVLESISVAAAAADVRSGVESHTQQQQAQAEVQFADSREEEDAQDAFDQLFDDGEPEVESDSLKQDTDGGSQAEASGEAEVDDLSVVEAEEKWDDEVEADEVWMDEEEEVSFGPFQIV
jgi:hypothetical protein